MDQTGFNNLRSSPQYQDAHNPISEALQMHNHVAEKELADLSAAHRTSIAQHTEVLEKGIAEHLKGPLAQQNEKLQQRLEAGRKELSQCLQDLQFISSTGHHSEYCSRRVRQLSDRLKHL